MSKPSREGGAPFEGDESRPRDGTSIVRELGPDRWLADRFRIESALGMGGMGHVFRAFDRVRETSVALKVVGELNPNSITQIKREFRSAAELVHPNLVRLHELFCDGSEWFFTMDLVDGVMLPELLAASPITNHDLLRDVFRQLAAALDALHRAGTLHGDLKPSNFLVRSSDGRVLLLDFGLARPLGPTQVRDFAGTPAYMAPEQALGEILTEAADWYSFGVVLHEVLTGALPPRRRPLAAVSDVPDDLSTLCRDLLAFDCTKRPSGAEVLRRIRAVDSDPQWAAAPPMSRQVLIGRTAELGRLEAAFEASQRGGPQIALVHGPSGIGKSALVERFIEDASRRGATVLAGRCRESESMGYKTVDGLLDDIIGLLSALGEDETSALLPPELSELVVLFPGLRNVPAIAAARLEGLESLDPSSVRKRAISGFSKLLAGLRREGPLLIWVDDLQWSDRESALLLGPLLGAPSAEPILFIGSHRGGERESPLLEALFADDNWSLPAPVDVAVRPLAPDDSERLALALLPEAQAELTALARSIGREAAGHPLFIAELAHSANPADGGTGAVASTLSELIQRRVSLLDADAQKLLEVTAVAGTPLSRRVLRRTCDLDASATEQALDVLRAARLARRRGPRDRGDVDVHHDRIREIVVSGLPAGRLRECHRSLANVLELEGSGSAEVLALHYEAAGEGGRAATYFIAAADRAFGALAFDHAARLYARGEPESVVDPSERHRIAIRRAEALAYSGDGAAAADVFLSAAVRCPPDDALELRRRAAEQLLLSGHLERGLLTVQEVVQELGMKPPRTGRYMLPFVLAGRLLVRARGFRHRPRPEPEVPRRDLARIDASWTLACSLSVLDFLRGAEYQSRHVLLALRAGEPKRLLRALTLEVSYSATPGVGSEKRTSELLEVASHLASSNTDPAAAGLLCLTRGIAAYLQANIGQSLSHCEDALAIFTRQCSGAVWETVTAHRFAIASSFFLGRFERLSGSVLPLSAEAETTGNVYASMCFRAGYSTVAWLALDRADDAKKQLDRTRQQWPRSGFQLSHYNLLVGDTLHDLYVGEARRAYDRLVQQWPALERARMLGVGVLRVQLWHSRAASAAGAALLAEACGRHTEARELRSEARRYLRRLRADPIKRAAPLSALVAAGIDRSEGDYDSAINRLEYATRAFETQGLALYAGAARLRLGEVVGGDQGAALIAEGRGAFLREAVVDVPRMVSALGPGG